MGNAEYMGTLVSPASQKSSHLYTQWLITLKERTSREIVTPFTRFASPRLPAASRPSRRSALTSFRAPRTSASTARDLCVCQPRSWLLPPASRHVVRVPTPTILRDAHPQARHRPSLPIGDREADHLHQHRARCHRWGHHRLVDRHPSLY